MEELPKITVLMPVYNVASYVQESIDSILKQTYQNFELLVINDGSTDNTRDEIMKFKSDKIRYIENEKNIGLANTLNKGIKLAKGEYIARMDGDDISLQTRLEKQLNILEKNPDLDICGAGYRFFGFKNNKVINPEKHDDIKAGLLFGCCMIIPLIRKKSIINAGLFYNQEFFPAEDYHFWTQCVINLKLYNLQEILFLYRIHSTQVSKINLNQQLTANIVKKKYILELFPLLNNQEADEFMAVSSKAISSQYNEDIKRIKQWITKILSLNEKSNNINEQALLKTLLLNKQAKQREFVVNNWFNHIYTIRKYITFIKSGFYFELPIVFRIKIFIKSIIY